MSTIVNDTFVGQQVPLTASSVGLGNVQNVDTTNPANIVTTNNYLFVTSTQVTTWNSYTPQKNIFTPITGGTVTISNSTSLYINNFITPATALLALTINFPSTPIDGQEVRFFFSKAITTLTFSIGTILGALTGAILGSGACWVYEATTTTWYRKY